MRREYKAGADWTGDPSDGCTFDVDMYENGVCVRPGVIVISTSAADRDAAVARLNQIEFKIWMSESKIKIAEEIGKAADAMNAMHERRFTRRVLAGEKSYRSEGR